MQNKINDILFQDTPHEIKQKETDMFQPDFTYILDKKTEETPTLPDSLFFQNKDIYISKHSRYAAYPKHSHQFFELNYVYHGTSTQLINGKKYELKQGDILLMDASSNHSIERMEYDDILINILFQNSQISLDWLNQLRNSNNVLYQFLSNKKTYPKNKNFIIISAMNNSHIKEVINQMLYEYFVSELFSGKIISHYLSILLYELARNLPTLESRDSTYINDNILNVLQLIDAEYNSLTLQKAADHLSFNKNYLSNLIKQNTGATFTELINQKRLMTAQSLIQTTRQPIEDIARKVGYSNITYFYKNYKRFFGHLPSVDR